ncbi:tetratricopeptide repeat protein [Pontibacter diazotrophicus]|uniref:Tetratricopeptide repeat protein n=1 Tax=Pontibacter diazotrophicus TaxID=1400979 RepID=A0A3D8L964_9BACT|nr:tetratricopeptide repeat protein [Pontibacter diazotrophicus]RDV13959.1 tetratricopeptide repeat protein [Pontibacter diazotrophicus]
MAYLPRLLFLLPFFFASCSLEEDNREQMVNLQQVKDNPEAQLVNLNAAIEQTGSDGSLYARRSVVLLRKGELEQALNDANKAVKLTRNEPSSLFVKAQVLRTMGKPEEALPLALQAERNSYQSSSLYVLLGDLYLQRNDYQQAQAYLNKAQELSPDDEFAFYYKGRVQEATGDTARAMQNYRNALEQAPAFVEAQRELAGLLVAEGDFTAAKPFLASALKAAPKDGVLWYYKGLVQKAEQKPDSALQAFSRAVSLNDTIQGAHYWLGIQQHKLGNNEAAISHLQRAASYKGELKYMTNLASAYERTGQNGLSLATYQRLVEAEPTYTYAYQAISRIKSKLVKPKPDSTAVRQVQIQQ